MTDTKPPKRRKFDLDLSVVPVNIWRPPGARCGLDLTVRIGIKNRFTINGGKWVFPAGKVKWRKKIQEKPEKLASYLVKELLRENAEETHLNAYPVHPEMLFLDGTGQPDQGGSLFKLFVLVSCPHPLPSPPFGLDVELTNQCQQSVRQIFASYQAEMAPAFFWALREYARLGILDQLALQHEWPGVKPVLPAAFHEVREKVLVPVPRKPKARPLLQVPPPETDSEQPSTET